MKKWALRIIQVVLVGVIIYSGYQIVDYLHGRQVSDEQFNEVAEEVESIRSDSEGAKEVERVVEISSNKEGIDLTELSEDTDVEYESVMSRLNSINEDSVGYIDILGTDIQYPVVQADDNSFYLWRGMDKQTDGQGSLFMDYENSNALSDQNTVIYGHNMRYGDEMFSSLKYYYEQDYADSMPKAFTITNGDGIYYYRLFSVYRVPADAPYRIPNVEDGQWVNFLENTRDQSETDFHFDRPFNEDDRVVTLSTCTEDHAAEYRTAVVGVLENVQTNSEDLGTKE